MTAGSRALPASITPSASAFRAILIEPSSSYAQNKTHKTPPFVRFPSVCPEPVLANGRFA